MTVTFSETVRVEGEVTDTQLRKLAWLSRRQGGAEFSSHDIAVIRSVVEALKVKRTQVKLGDAS